MTAGPSIQVHPLTPERWDHLVQLFGAHGASSGCWCMWWRQTASEFAAKAGEKNREEFRAIVASERVPGLLAYEQGVPVGWCSIGPREDFGRLNRSPTLKRVDDSPAWSIVCFYIKPRSRGKGVGAALLQAAVAHAASRGASVVEGYPLDESTGPVTNAGAFTGVLAMFREAGFKEVARRSARRPIMRREIS
ncbi:MAG: GNAT family N-acetyltransferase [Dehalococcoidia bacterium]|nr:GNAT family N-acetyltransferase [Dehalococcoidia bacterium]